MSQQMFSTPISGTPCPLWLSLRFPRLALDALQSGQHPLILVEDTNVYQACERAQALGITPGTSLNTALLLGQSDAANADHALMIRPRNEEQEKRQLTQLGQWAYQFTPYVSVWPEQDSLLLELSRCLKFFGGLSALLERIRTTLEPRALTTIASLAHTPKAAWLLGWQSEHNVLNQHWQLTNSKEEPSLESSFFLSHLALMNLSLLPAIPPFSEKLLRQLHNIGLTKLGEFLQLPRHSIARRYSKQVLQQLDQLTGNAQDLQTYITPSTSFSSERHYLYGLEDVEQLHYPMMELLTELQVFLRTHQLRTESFDWYFTHFDRNHTRVSIELSGAQSSADVFWQLSEIKLHQHHIHSPIETLRLDSHQLYPANQHSESLFKELGGQKHNEANALIDTLKARLGKQALYQIQALDDHLPECRQGLTHPQPRKKTLSTATCPELKKSNRSEKSKEPAISLWPNWLLSTPQPLTTQQRRQMTLHSSPYRLDSHWWQQRQQRDYFIAENQQGLHWIYFDHGQKRWFLHGHYG